MPPGERVNVTCDPGSLPHTRTAHATACASSNSLRQTEPPAHLDAGLRATRRTPILAAANSKSTQKLDNI